MKKLNLHRSQNQKPEKLGPSGLQVHTLNHPLEGREVTQKEQVHQVLEAGRKNIIEKLVLILENKKEKNSRRQE